MIQAASTCFWAFAGFETATCAVEESRNPRRDIPVAMICSLVLVTVLYVCTTLALTLIVPWSLIDVDAPLASAMSHIGLDWGRYVVSVGTLCGFTTALISSVYGFARNALAIAEDGLLPRWFAWVPVRTGVPTFGVIVCAIVASLVAFSLDISSIVEFSVNLILLSYSAVCICIIILRYRKDSPSSINKSSSLTDVTQSDSVTSSKQQSHSISPRPNITANEALSDAEEELPDLNRNQNNSNSCDTCSRQESKSAEKMLVLQNRCEEVESFSVRTNVDGMEGAGDVMRDSFAVCEPITGRCEGKSVHVLLAIMLMCGVGFALTVVYATVQLENGVWWAAIIITLLSFGILVPLAVIGMHRQSYDLVNLRVC